MGKRVRFGGERLPWFEVVGVVGSITYDGPGIAFPTLYHPANQTPNFAARSRYLVVKTGGEPRALVDGVRGVVRGLDARQAIASTYTMDEIQGLGLARPRFILTLFGRGWASRWPGSSWGWLEPWPVPGSSPGSSTK